MQAEPDSTPSSAIHAFVLRQGGKALRALGGAAALVLLVLLLAGMPLLVDRSGGSWYTQGQPSFRFAPERIVQAAAAFVEGLPSGRSFAILIGRTEWNLLELAPRFFLVSGFYLALPLALGVGLGTFAGAAHRSRRRGPLDRGVDLFLALPDFLLALVLQFLAMSLNAWLGTEISLGMTGGSFVLLLPLLVMSAYPFCLAYRVAAEESRKAETSNHITFARAKGLDERTILRRHIGAGIIPRLETELPSIVAYMQTTLYIAELVFALPGMTKMLFNNTFAGPRTFYLRSDYQYNLVALSLLGSVLVCLCVYALVRASLALVKEALIHG